MGTIVYNKLVRDKIPEIIEQSGKSIVTEILSDEQYIKILDEKLNEELSEFQKSKDIEELADLLEVIYTIARVRGIEVEELEQIRKEKRTRVEDLEIKYYSKK